MHNVLKKLSFHTFMRIICSLGFGAILLAMHQRICGNYCGNRLCWFCNKLCRTTKLHPKTVRNYLKIAEWIQAQGKIIMERQNFKDEIGASPLCFFAIRFVRAGWCLDFTMWFGESSGAFGIYETAKKELLGYGWIAG